MNRKGVEMNQKKMMECVPNFSEGRNLQVVEAIAEIFRNAGGVALLNASSDADHNRSVMTLVGEPEALGEAVVAAVGKAMELIDLRKQSGQHPRIGAVDVIPFIPLKNLTIDDAAALARQVGQEIGTRYEIPVYLYEQAATAAHRENLAEVRRGQFEGLAEKMSDTARWTPDFGPARPHPTFGATAVGARKILCAYNVNLGTDRMEVAEAIAKKVRCIGGGLRYCKAMGVRLKERNQVQVSMNLTDYEKTPLYQAVELIRIEAARYGVPIVGTEVIGLLPQAALLDCAEYYLQIENFSADRVIENCLWENEW